LYIDLLRLCSSLIVYSNIKISRTTKITLPSLWRKSIQIRLQIAVNYYDKRSSIVITQNTNITLKITQWCNTNKEIKPCCAASLLAEQLFKMKLKEDHLSKIFSYFHYEIK